MYRALSDLLTKHAEMAKVGGVTVIFDSTQFLPEQLC